jgi:uncharacterized protein (DUF1499 family)
MGSRPTIRDQYWDMMIKTGMRAFSYLAIALSVIIAGCSGVRPANLGVKDGKFAPCPASTNCVSSQSTDKEHAVAPLYYTTSVPQAMGDLKKIILGMKRARIVDEGDYYIRAEFTSALWRFVDDVEFYFDEGAKVIHVRSASRVGKSDFGVNRKRVEEIRALWASAKNKGVERDLD